jgi:hypothetical protein
MIEAVFVAAGLFGTPEKPDAQELESKARDFIERAYERPEVARWCTDNPQSIYTVEIEEVTITVRCAAWAEWRKSKQL